jgi:hypothetical protein
MGAGASLGRGVPPEPRESATEVGTRRQYFGGKQQDAFKLARISSLVLGAGAQIKNAAQDNMPSQPVSDPQVWRNPAAKVRAKADQTIDDRTKRLLLRIAESHEGVAELVE